MTEVRFYHLETSRIEEEAPRLLEKAYGTGLKTLVRCDAADEAALDRALWTYDAESFLPHGRADEKTSADQPILITSDMQNANGAELLLAINGAYVEDAAQFQRCFYMFNGLDDAVLQKARADWKALKDRDLTLSYWQKEPPGKWIQKA